MWTEGTVKTADSDHAMMSTSDATVVGIVRARTCTLGVTHSKVKGTSFSIATTSPMLAHGGVWILKTVVSPTTLCQCSPAFPECHKFSQPPPLRHRNHACTRQSRRRQSVLTLPHGADLRGKWTRRPLLTYTERCDPCLRWNWCRAPRCVR